MLLACIYTIPHYLNGSNNPVNHMPDNPGGEGTGGSESPASRTLYSQFLLPSLVVSTAARFFYCEKLCNVAKFISYFSQLPHPWVSHLLPSLLPSPVDFLLPLLPGSRSLVPLHIQGLRMEKVFWVTKLHSITPKWQDYDFTPVFPTCNLCFFTYNM